jgi:hypothetical protein
VIFGFCVLAVDNNATGAGTAGAGFAFKSWNPDKFVLPEMQMAPAVDESLIRHQLADIHRDQWETGNMINGLKTELPEGIKNKIPQILYFKGSYLEGHVDLLEQAATVKEEMVQIRTGFADLIRANLTQYYNLVGEGMSRYLTDKLLELPVEKRTQFDQEANAAGLKQFQETLAEKAKKRQKRSSSGKGENANHSQDPASSQQSSGSSGSDPQASQNVARGRGGQNRGGNNGAGRWNSNRGGKHSGYRGKK